ncbi:maspardin-like isoform X2 [Ornithodoros turicata]|uniref:maspardin-like isoform X2 n=1 Tax=Ornithodoros turicata TaxID=34597 RepID=UPI00313A3A77
MARMLQLLGSKPASDIAQSPEYRSFRETVPQRRVIVDDNPSQVWTYYDYGPRSVTCPLICLPPISGTADVFFRQIMVLSARGYRVMSVEYPVYWTLREWVVGFRKFLDHLCLDQVHILGASLGGFLAQKFAESTAPGCPQRVCSLVLCNSFSDTSIFNYTDTAVLFWLCPAVMLKRMVMGSYDPTPTDTDIAEAVDFMVEKLESLSQSELASRLTLNCMNAYVEPHKLEGIPITIIDVFDDSALSLRVKEDLYKLYPQSRRAHLKKGGNFPFLSRSDEVAVHLQVHLRQFEGSQQAARET